MSYGVEVCSGSGVLSATLARHGLRMIAIDYEPRLQSKVEFLKRDLRNPEDARDVLGICQNACFVHMAPPCGTFSRAREIGWGPRPLRSERHPAGLADLTQVERARVDSANKVAAACLRIARQCQRLGIPYTLENPGRSLLWWMPGYAKLLRSSHNVLFDMCMHGGRRKKYTCLVTNAAVFNQLSRECDGKHDHLPWDSADGRFLTAEESQYPALLCNRIARLSMVAVADEQD